jgi:hypothetical protein
VRFRLPNRYKLTGGNRGTHRLDHGGVSTSCPHASILYPVLLRVQKRERSSESVKMKAFASLALHCTSNGVVSNPCSTRRAATNQTRRGPRHCNSLLDRTSTRSWWQWLKRLSTQGRHGPLEREHAPENGPKPPKIVIGMPLKASGGSENRDRIRVSSSRCPDIPPRGGARNGIGEESRLRRQSFTERRPAIYKKLIQ